MRAPRSVHTYLVGLILGVLLPLLVFSSFLVIHSAEREQEAMALQATNRTRSAAAAVENELSALRGRLFLLASGLGERNSDLSDFYVRAKEAFGGLTVVLVDASGREIVNTGMPYGASLPDYPDRDSFRYVVDNLRARVSGLSKDAITQRFAVTINVPIIRDGKLEYVLALDILPTLPRIFDELALPEGWIAGIFDRNGYLIGRSRDPDRFVGGLVSQEFRNRIQGEENGWVPGTSWEGVPLFNAFAHTRVGEWTVNVGMPRDTLLAPVRRTTWSLIALGAASLALAITLAYFIARRIARPLIDLVPIAEAVGHGEPAVPRPSRLTEANVVARSLRDAGERLREAAARQAASTTALTQSEQMYRALAEDLARVDLERNALLTRVVVAQESERKRIARELHDSLAQYLTALRLQLDAPDKSQREIVTGLRSLIDDLGLAVNRLAWELRPVALEELGLHTAVDHYLEEWAELARIPVDVEIDLGGHTLPPAVEATLFRVLQEATTNVLRHAGATHAGVILDVKGDVVRLIVEDDGKGFAANDGGPPFAAGRQFGLLGMRERLALVHGELEVESAPERGTTLFVSIRLEAKRPGKGSTYHERKDPTHPDGGRSSDSPGRLESARTG